MAMSEAEANIKTAKASMVIIVLFFFMMLYIGRTPNDCENLNLEITSMPQDLVEQMECKGYANIPAKRPGTGMAETVVIMEDAIKSIRKGSAVSATYDSNLNIFYYKTTREL